MACGLIQLGIMSQDSVCWLIGVGRPKQPPSENTPGLAAINYRSWNYQPVRAENRGAGLIGWSVSREIGELFKDAGACLFSTDFAKAENVGEKNKTRSGVF